MIVIGIVLALAVIGFIGLFVYYFLNPLPLPESVPVEQPNPQVAEQEQSQTTEVPKEQDKTIISPIPEIMKVDFPEKIPLNQKVNGTIEFRDGDGDLSKLVFEYLDGSSSSVLELERFGTAGNITFSRNRHAQRFELVRLTLVDSAGHMSEPYILKYQIGDPVALQEHYDNEQAAQRPISRHKKVHFFILSGTNTELETDSSFASDNDAVGDVSPSVAKVFEKTVVPQVNGLWDQCGIEFDLGMVKAVRAEKVKLKNGGLLSNLYGTHDGKPVVLLSPTVPLLLNEASQMLGVPKGDHAIFILGYRLWSTELNATLGGTSGFRNAVLMSWPYIHFLNKDAGEILIPKNIFTAFAHELGHVLGLKHPGEEKTIPQSQFSEFNLMNREMYYNEELMPEQCKIVNKYE